MTDRLSIRASAGGRHGRQQARRTNQPAHLSPAGSPVATCRYLSAGLLCRTCISSKQSGDVWEGITQHMNHHQDGGNFAGAKPDTPEVVATVLGGFWPSLKLLTWTRIFNLS